MAISVATKGKLADKKQVPAYEYMPLGDDVVYFQGAGVPVDGTSGTGAGMAGKGSLYIDRTNANHYINGNTKASPTWKLVTRAA